MIVGKVGKLGPTTFLLTEHMQEIISSHIYVIYDSAFLYCNYDSLECTNLSFSCTGST